MLHVLHLHPQYTPTLDTSAYSPLASSDLPRHYDALDVLRRVWADAHGRSAAFRHLTRTVLAQVTMSGDPAPQQEDVRLAHGWLATGGVVLNTQIAHRAYVCWLALRSSSWLPVCLPSNFSCNVADGWCCRWRQCSPFA